MDKLHLVGKTSQILSQNKMGGGTSHFVQPESVVLGRFVAFVKEHTDITEVFVKVTTSKAWTNCGCMFHGLGKRDRWTYPHCSHGRDLPDDAISIDVEIYLPGREEPLFSWKEARVQGVKRYRITSLEKEKLMTREMLCKQSILFEDIVSFFETNYVRDLASFRRERTKELLSENRKLRKENKRLVEELYAPGGAIFFEAKRHFESFKE